MRTRPLSIVSSDRPISMKDAFFSNKKTNKGLNENCETIITPDQCLAISLVNN